MCREYVVADVILTSECKLKNYDAIKKKESILDLRKEECKERGAGRDPGLGFHVLDCSGST